MKKIWTIFILLILSSSVLIAQNKLIFHTEFVDQLMRWMDTGCSSSNTNKLAIQPAASIMEQLLKKQEGKTTPDFIDVLKSYNYADSTSGSIYLLNEAYKYKGVIAALLEEIKKSDFTESIYSRGLKYFPCDYVPPRRYEVFFTATGWKWGDAMTFNYAVENNKYTISSSGVPAIIFNLTLVSKLYGNSTTERMAQLENVMSHELFHAIFADYRTKHWNNEKVWTEGKLENKMLYLMLNEGFAHYISYRELLIENYNKNERLIQYEKDAFEALATNSNIIFNSASCDSLKNSALGKGLYGNFWEKYICVTGFFMAYHIEQHYGIEGLKECILNTPFTFIKKYSIIPDVEHLPKIPEPITKYVSQ